MRLVTLAPVEGRLARRGANSAWRILTRGASHEAGSAAPDVPHHCLPGSFSFSNLSNSTFHSSPLRFSTRRT